MKGHLTSAFSLVEVTLALGIAAFCLIAVFGLMPVGMQTNRNAKSQTNATNIITAVIADLRSTPITTITTPTSLRFGITLGTNVTRYFDSEGRCSCDGAGLQKFNSTTGSCSDTWSPTLQLRYQLNVTWNVANPTGACSAALPCADLKVTWPAAATAANASGSVEMFAGFDRK
jgi:uncharacterized protein (TIGR02598 family)